MDTEQCKAQYFETCSRLLDLEEEIKALRERRRELRAAYQTIMYYESMNKYSSTNEENSQ